MKTVTFEQAQAAYDNRYDVEAEFEFDDEYEDSDFHRTELVEMFVTYANAEYFSKLCWREVEGDPNAWIEKLIGHPEGHWAHQFVVDELEALSEEA
jgi:hypothetical protein